MVGKVYGIWWLGFFLYLYRGVSRCYVFKKIFNIRKCLRNDNEWVK